jgi:very-short-patch-repair endonuclease
MNQESWQTNRARKLRRELTPAERILWKELRGRRFAGLKFRRQFPVSPYVLDFYCFELKLSLEIDGESHLDNNGYDERRQQAIEAEGIKTLRFWNTQVFDELDSVLEAIWNECEARKKMISEGSALTPGPSPRGRGETEASTIRATTQQ